MVHAAREVALAGRTRFRQRPGPPTRARARDERGGRGRRSPQGSHRSRARNADDVSAFPRAWSRRARPGLGGHRLPHATRVQLHRRREAHLPRERRAHTLGSCERRSARFHCRRARGHVHERRCSDGCTWIRRLDGERDEPRHWRESRSSARWPQRCRGSASPCRRRGGRPSTGRTRARGQRPRASGSRARSSQRTAWKRESRWPR